jgi:hypothetical protein
MGISSAAVPNPQAGAARKDIVVESNCQGISGNHVRRMWKGEP